jgi:hypothetical protein
VSCANIGAATSGHDHDDDYVKLDPGTVEQTIKSSIVSLAKGVINLWRSSGNDYTFLGFSNGTTETYLGGIGFKSQSDKNLYRRHSNKSNYYKIWDEGNDGSGSGLDADYLDGYDIGDVLHRVTVANNTTNNFNNFSNMTLTGRGDPTSGASLSNAPWSGSGPAGGYGVLTYLWSSYGIQMAWGYASNRTYIRNKYYTGSGAAWGAWTSLALSSDIPSLTDFSGGEISSSENTLT